jgi:hypothetical protein
MPTKNLGTVCYYEEGTTLLAHVNGKQIEVVVKNLHSVIKNGSIVINYYCTHKNWKQDGTLDPGVMVYRKDILEDVSHKYGK